MGKYLLYAIVATIALSFGSVFCLLEPEIQETVNVFSYNYNWLPREKENVWQMHKSFIVNEINKLNPPSIIAFQAIPKNQLDNLRLLLADYTFFGEPRSFKMAGLLQRWFMKHPTTIDEYNPIFYNAKKVRVIKGGNYGINPHAPRFTADLPYVCTWGLFEEISTGKRCYVYSTHLLDIGNNLNFIIKKQLTKILKYAKKKSKIYFFSTDLSNTYMFIRKK